MSLKIFHIIVILCSILLSVGFGGWGLSRFQQQASAPDMIIAAGSFMAAVGLTVYVSLFLKRWQGVK